MKKVEKLRKWMAVNDYDGIILGRRDNYTWISDGAKNHVTSNTETGVAYYVIEPDHIWLFADSSDLPRMSKEQNPLGAEPVLVPWYMSMEERLKETAQGKKYVSDTGIAGTANVQEELVDLRMQLSEEEVDRYREVGAACAQIVEKICKEARPGQTEEEIADRVKCSCIEQGISPDCVLVGADERMLDFRHPMPTNKEIKKSLMVVLGGEKYGLYISMTRIVYFDEIPEEIYERYQKTQYVFACMQQMMHEGMEYSEYFANVQKLYDDAGYEGEWKMHHQGGPTGYGCREFVVIPGLDKKIHTGQAYAWNPTIQGTKCEETTYLTDEKVEIFTRTKDWPCTIVRTPYGEISVADILLKQRKTKKA